MAGIREEFWVSTMTGEQEDKSASAMSSRTWTASTGEKLEGKKHLLQVPYSMYSIYSCASSLIFIRIYKPIFKTIASHLIVSKVVEK